MLLGGNLLTHYTHSRDLRYVYTLAARYNTKEKIFETMALAESHGVNAVVIHTAAGVVDWLQEYRNKHGGKMKWIICPTADITDDMKAYTDACKMLRDIGTDSIYLWGVRGDQLSGIDLRGNQSTPRPDLMAKAVEAAKNVGLPAGVGAHRLEVIKSCEENDIPADYYIKTLHSAEYPSVDIGHDNRWSFTPNDTIEFMKNVKKPWIAFKVNGGRGPHPATRIHLRLPEWCRFLARWYVRLRDHRKCCHHERGPCPAKRDQPRTSLDRVIHYLGRLPPNNSPPQQQLSPHDCSHHAPP